LSLLAHERTYGFALPAGYSIVTIAGAASLVALGWRRLAPPLRRFGLAAAAINLPLLLLFCAPGETRNLSLLYPLLVCLIAASADRLAAAAA
jgi:hypothetical protein